MREYFEENRPIPIRSVPLGEDSYFEAGRKPIGMLVYVDGEFRVKSRQTINDIELRDSLASREVFDAFGLIEAFDDRKEKLDLPIGNPDFDDDLTMFFARSACSLYNRHSAALNLPSPPPLSSRGMINTNDFHKILKLLHKGYVNHGMRARGFYVPVFTAFPLVRPAIGVSLSVTQSTTKSVGFKLSLPGVGGGFSGSSTCSFSLTHPANPDAIQYQQEMEADIITWKHRSTGHEIDSFSFRILMGDRIAYDDGSPGNGFLVCHVANGRAVVVDKKTIMPNPRNPAVPYNIGIGKRFSESFEFDASQLIPGLNLDMATETQEGFTVSYELSPGYEYKFWGSRKTTHFIAPEATTV